MYSVYVLRSSKDNNLYIGVTNNLNKRIEEHNNGLDKSTKYRRPLRLIYFETFFDKADAYSRERYLKTGWGRKHLRHALKNTLRNSRAVPLKFSEKNF